MLENENHYIVNYRRFAMYSEFYRPGMNIKKHTDVQKIFDKEILSAVKDGAYLGMFHIAALASVLQRNIQSVYPQYAGHTVRKDYHNLIVPRLGLPLMSVPLYIMWTNCKGKAEEEKQWAPNHFVPLLPLHIAAIVEDIEVEEDCQVDWQIPNIDDIIQKLAEDIEADGSPAATTTGQDTTVR